MKLKRRKIKRGRIEIIPMIDTVVILLIFYMTFSRFAEASRQAGLTLPTSRAGKDAVQAENQVVVNMFKSDEVYVSKVRYNISDLPSVLQRIKANPKFKDLSVILRGHTNMKYTDLSDFLRACAKAKITDVTFATTEPTR